MSGFSNNNNSNNNNNNNNKDNKMSGFSFNDNTMGGGGYGPNAGYMGPDGILRLNSLIEDDIKMMRSGGTPNGTDGTDGTDVTDGTTDVTDGTTDVTDGTDGTGNSSNALKYRLAAESAHPYMINRSNNKASYPLIITHTNLTFDQIPSVTGVPIRRQFYPPRKHLCPGNFVTVIEWEEFVRIVEGYLDQIKIKYNLPETVAAFSIHGTPSDPKLDFDIHYCPVPMNKDDREQKFVIEFRRVRGDAFALSKIFFGLKELLVPASQEDQEDQEDLEAFADTEDLELGSSSQYTIPPYDNTKYSGTYFSFDDLIEKKN
jgi:hypothetical protein